MTDSDFPQQSSGFPGIGGGPKLLDWAETTVLLATRRYEVPNMSPYYEPYAAAAVAAIIVIGVAGIILILNRVLGPRRMTRIKATPFESGKDPADSPRHRFTIKFYMTAILFLVFDLEVVFIYPWAAKFRDFLADSDFAAVGLLGMLAFVTVLALGLLYEWRRGAMDWE